MVDESAILFQLSGIGVVETDLSTGRFLRVNQAFCEMVGYSEAELQTMTSTDLTHPEDWERVGQRFASTKQGELHEDKVLTLVLHKDGHEVWLELHVSVLPKAGEGRNIILVRDISESKRTELALQKDEALRASEALARTQAAELRALTEATSDVLYRMSADWTEMRQLNSDAFLANTEHPTQTWLENYIPVRAREPVAEAIQKAIETKSVFELEHPVVRADGSEGWTFSRAVPLLDAQGEVSEWLGVASDTTERRRAEAALRTSEERLRLSVESILDHAIFTTDPDGLITSWNAGAERVFGYSEAEIVGHDAAILFTPEDREASVPDRELQTAREQGKANDDRWHLRKGGERFFASGAVSPIWESSRLTGYVKIARDLTRQRQAEEEREMLLEAVKDFNTALEQRVKERTEELEQSNVRFSQAFEVAPIPAVITTLGQETFLEVNDAFLKLSRYSHDEVIGKSAFDLGMWSSRDDQQKLQKALEDQTGFRELELHLQDKEGNIHDILLSAEVIHLDGEHGYLKMFYDITDRKRTERELAEALRQVVSDTTWFSQQVMERLGYIRAGEPGKEMVQLTGRERQILEHIAKGWNNKKIAKDLRLNEQTVRNYISNLYSKLDVHSRAEAIVWARERNIGS